MSLTDEQVIAIRQMGREFSYRVVGEKYNLHPSAICRIMHGRLYGRLKEGVLPERKILDVEFHREIGRKGGSTPKSTPSGFAVHRDLARTAGRKGGRISRRKYVETKKDARNNIPTSSEQV